MPRRELLPCESSDLDWFTDDPDEALACATLCISSCPAQADCYSGAIARDEEAGIWGGASFNKRNPTYRRRGRPRKDKTR